VKPSHPSDPSIPPDLGPPPCLCLPGFSSPKILLALGQNQGVRAKRLRELIFSPPAKNRWVPPHSTFPPSARREHLIRNQKTSPKTAYRYLPARRAGFQTTPVPRNISPPSFGKMSPRAGNAAPLLIFRCLLGPNGAGQIWSTYLSLFGGRCGVGDDMRGPLFFTSDTRCFCVWRLRPLNESRRPGRRGSRQPWPVPPIPEVVPPLPILENWRGGPRSNGPPGGRCGGPRLWGLPETGKTLVRTSPPRQFPASRALLSANGIR